VNLAEAVAARRSVRSFLDRSVPRPALERAVALAVQAPAPHHSQPWRFVFLEDPRDKERFSAAMGAAWREDLARDGVAPAEVDRIVNKSHGLLTSTPVLAVCCADMSRSHSYSDERRRRAEWSLFAHSVGAALQTFMTALAEEGIASCWISAPVFCGDVVKSDLGLPPHVEPHALVLVGYASPEYRPRPRPQPDPGNYILP
jgi:coenzyme F420-0:L-glutamate ligase / coenzyme F420-1:gamma-L-glutamate ligase